MYKIRFNDNIFVYYYYKNIFIYNDIRLTYLNISQFGNKHIVLYNINVSKKSISINIKDNTTMYSGRKVYVLTALREHESYTSSNEVLGVYKSKGSAENAMNDAFDKEIAKWQENMNGNEFDINIKRDSEMCSIYDTFGGVEYTEFSISVKLILD